MSNCNNTKELMSEKEVLNEEQYADGKKLLEDYIINHDMKIQKCSKKVMKSIEKRMENEVDEEIGMKTFKYEKPKKMSPADEQRVIMNVLILLKKKYKSPTWNVFRTGKLLVIQYDFYRNEDNDVVSFDKYRRINKPRYNFIHILLILIGIISMLIHSIVCEFEFLANFYFSIFSCLMTFIIVCIISSLLFIYFYYNEHFILNKYSQYTIGKRYINHDKEFYDYMILSFMCAVACFLLFIYFFRHLIKYFKY